MLLTSCAYAQTTYTWNGSVSTSWTTAANWTPSTGTPGATDHVVIVTGTNVPTLAANASCTNFTMTSGTLNLGGFTLTTSGTNTFSNGTIQNGTLSAIAGGNSVFTATTFAGTCTVNMTLALVTINGGTFNGPTTLIQNGAGTSTGTGNATFNGTTTIECAGAGSFRTNGNMVFNSTTNLRVSNSGYLLLELTTGNTYNGTTTCKIVTGANGNLRMCYLGSTTFNGNIILENTGTGYIYFCEQASATATLAGTYTISVGAAGFSSGRLYLYRFTQLGGVAQNLIFTGTSYVTFGPTTVFNGNLTVTAIDFYTGNCTYNGTFTWNKTGGTNNACTGGNIFTGTTTFNNTSAAYQLMGNGLPDIFNGDVITNNTGTERIILAYSSLGNQFNGNVTVSQSGGGTGTYLGFPGTTTSVTLANSKTVNVSGAFAVGVLSLCKFTQLGGTAQSLTTTGTSSVFLEGNSLFNGSVTVTAPDIYVRGATFNAPATFTKTGINGNHNNGNQNIFNSTCTINQQGSGYFLLGYNSNDLFNDDVIVTSTGTGGVALGWNGGTCTPTLAATKTIQIGPAGFSNGFLRLGGFTQLGTAPINITLTGLAYLEINNCPANSVFGGDFSITAPDIYVRGGTFNGAATFTKTGVNGNHNSGVQNIFNSTCTINQQGSAAGYFMLGYNSNDLFNGDIIVTNTGTGGVALGWNGGTCTPTLAATKNIQIGPAGFSGGYLRLGGFTQLGTAPINLTLTGTAYLEINNCPANSVFGGDFTVTAPDIYVRGGIFNSPATFIKTGGTSNHNNGVQNIFNSTCEVFQQSNAGYFMLGYNSNDLFNDNIIVSSTGTGGIYFGWGSGTGTPTLAATKTILVGSGGFNAGFLAFNTFTQLGSAPVNLTFTGTSAYMLFARSSVFGGDFTGIAPDLFFNGCTFNGLADFTKTGASNDASLGGNVFNGISNFINNGNGYLLFGNSNPDIFNADVTFTNTGAERILPAWSSAGNMFNGNITVNSTGSSVGIHFCGGTVTANATLAATKTIQTGMFGYNAGYLILPRFTQLGSAPVNLTMTSPASYLQYGPTSTFGGNVTSVSPRVLFQGCTFNGTGDFTKNGAIDDVSNGGNIFNGTSTFTNQGTGYLLLGNASADVWNSDVTFTNASTSRILPAWNTAGNMLNGNITVNSTGSAVGIQFCGGASATATIAATKTIQTGGLGYSAGYLILTRVTQLGSAPVNLTITAPGSYIQYGPSSNLGGNVLSVSPGVLFNGCVFNGTGTFTKNGTSNDGSTGGNIFNGVSSFTNTGSGYLLLGNSVADTWNSNVTFSNSGPERILPCWNSAGNSFNGDITVNSSGSSVGINFCGGSVAANATLAATKTIQIGTTYNAGYLILQRFTQLGSAPVNLTLTAPATYLQYGPTSTFGGNVTSVSPGLYFNGCTYNGTGTFTKNGSTNDASAGGNIFNGISIFNDNGSGYLLFGNGNFDQFNSTATFNNNGSSYIYTAYNSTGNIFNDVVFNNTPTSSASYIVVSQYGINTQFNGNITVNSTLGNGVQFCQSTGTATLAATKTIAVGGTGFTAGTLLLRNFTQTGATPQTLTLTGTSTLTFSVGSTFNGNVTSSSPSLFFNGTTFNGTNLFTKTGSTNDASSGGNIFNGASTFTNNGSGNLLFANGTVDDYNANVTFVKNSTGPVYPNYAANCTYSGNISTLGSNAVITFGSGSGRMTIDGTSPQQFNGPVAFPPTVTRWTMNNALANISLNVDVNATLDIAFNAGDITTTAATSTGTGLLILANGITFSNAPDNGSNVIGYVRKIGNAAFTFPTGDGNFYKPIAMTAPTNAAHHFTTKYFPLNPHPTYDVFSKDVSLNNIDNCEYWIFDRTNGTSNVNVTISWDNASTPPCQVVNLADLRVARWNGTMWKNEGNTATAGSASAGTVTSGVITSFSPIALASITALNTLPIELTSFTATPENANVHVKWTTMSETNNDYFTIEKSTDGINFEFVEKVNGAGNSVSALNYSVIDQNPYLGISYYRLKQTDFNGDYTYSSLEVVDFTSQGENLMIYPNPSNGLDAYLSLMANENGPIEITLTGVNGQKIFTSTQNLTKGLNTISMNFNEQLAAGMYLLNVMHAGTVTTQKFVVKH